MIFKMYAIKDELNGFTCPIPFSDERVVKRYMKDQYMGNPTIKNSPKDFSIWKVGEFDTETAAYTSITPELVERASNYGE